MSWKSWCRRPSSLLLLGLLAANVAVPVEHYLSRLSERSGAPVITPQIAVRPARVEPTGPVPVRAPPLEAALVPPERECRAWGPFEEIEQAWAAADRMGLDGSDIEVSETGRPEPDEYLVYVALDGSPAQLARAREDLASEQIDSQQLAGQGGRAALAVGVFKTERRAESHRARVAALGLETHVRTLAREHKAYYLLGKVPTGSETDIPALGTCNEIAPGRQVL